MNAQAQESAFNSAVFRDHKKRLKELEDRRRRQSIAIRTEIRKENRVNERKMIMKKIEEDHAVIEEKAESFKAMRAYKKKQEEDRRISLAGRNAEGSRQKQLLEQQRSEQQQRDHQSYELTWAGQDDAAAYKKQMAEERRQSYENRNAEGFQQKQLLEQQRSEQQQRDHESYELTWAGQDDAAAYKKQMAEERRQSYENRNAEARQMNLVLKEIKTIAAQKEHESMMLKWAAQNDAKQYLSECEEQRRQSLQQRAELARHHRDVEEHERQDKLENQAKENQIAAAEARDVNTYKKQLAARDRASLCFRAKEAKLNRLLEESNAIVEKEKEVSKCIFLGLLTYFAAVAITHSPLASFTPHTVFIVFVRLKTTNWRLPRAMMCETTSKSAKGATACRSWGEQRR